MSEARHSRWWRVLWGAAITASVSAATIMTLALTRRRVIAWSCQHMQRLLRETHLREHFERTRRTCAGLQRSLSTTLLSAIDERLSTDDLLAELHRQPSITNSEACVEKSSESAQRRLNVWRQLKRLAVQRVLVAVHGCVWLTLAAQVYTHALAACGAGQSSWCRSSVGDTNSNLPTLSEEEQQLHMRDIQHFAEEGVWRLLDRLCEAATRLADQLPLKQPLSMSQLEQQLRQAVRDVTAGGPRLADALVSKPALICNNSDENGGGGDLHRLRDETCDIVASEETARVLTECVDAALSQAVCRLGAECRPAEEVPVARLLPMLCRLPYNLLTDGEHCLHVTVANHRRMQALAANVFECYAQ